MDTKSEIIIVKENIDQYKVMGQALKNQADLIRVMDNSDVERGRKILETCQMIEKTVEIKRKEVLNPVKDFVNLVNEIAKTALLPTNEAKSIIQKKLTTYSQEQQLKRIEEERKRLEEESKRQEVLFKEQKRREEEERAKRQKEEEEIRLARVKQDAEEARLMEEKIKFEREKREFEEQKNKEQEEKRLEEERKKIEDDLKKKSQEEKVKGLRKRWTYKVDNEADIPREFCSSDSKKINEAIRKGIRQITGITIYQEETVI